MQKLGVVEQALLILLSQLGQQLAQLLFVTRHRKTTYPQELDSQ